MPAPGLKKRTVAQCQLCGKRMSNAGLIGHMAWAHGKDHRRPLLASKPHPVREARRKAREYDALLLEIPPIVRLRNRLEMLAVQHKGEAYMAEAMPMVTAYCQEQGVTEADLYRELSELQKQPRVTAEDVRQLFSDARRKATRRGK